MNKIQYNNFTTLRAVYYSVMQLKEILHYGFKLFKKHQPAFEISKYNKQPNIKKPRKWRRILRRKLKTHATN